MESPKIALSPAEQSLLADASVILTKNSVIDKVCILFGEMGNRFYCKYSSLSADYPSIFQPQPKVSKGEKYQQLPWVMLDYPRYFGKDGHLAIRCFCWWGNCFSIQLQVSGIYLKSLLAALPNWQSKKDDAWMFGLTKDPWNMELPNAEWMAMTSQLVDYPIFLKVAKKIPIDEWELLEEKLLQYFDDLMELVTTGLTHQSGAAIP